MAVLGAVQRGPAGPGGRVHDRELDLLLGRVQVHEQLVAGVHDLGDPRVRPVHLVDHQDHRQARFQRLAQHEPGLRQRPLAGVDQQQHAVHHGQAALHLAAEVGVPGGVDDVDGQPAVADRGVLGQDRDALFPLQVTGVEHTVGHVGVGPERTGLPEHRVDQGGLAVVNVRDDGDVTQVVAGGEGRGGRGADRHAGRLRVSQKGTPDRGRAQSRHLPVYPAQPFRAYPPGSALTRADADAQARACGPKTRIPRLSRRAGRDKAFA